MFEITKTGLTSPPCLKIAFMPRLGTPELIIILVTGIFCVARSLRERLQIRTLTFERTADILIAVGIVTAWLVTFLFLSHIYATL